MNSRFCFLVGPTAAGKTGVAHCIARSKALPILSIDSMLVYQGMDIGTAKPSLSDRQGISYYGIDLVSPDVDFSIQQFYSYVQCVIRETAGPIIVCGGTGLYAKALTEEFDAGTAPDASFRLEWEAAVRDRGVGPLQDELKRIAPEAYAALKDPANPRRLIRALERARVGVAPADSWDTARKPVLTGLDSEPGRLKERIEQRVDRMFDGGLVEEVQGLLAKYGTMSRTAMQAIGYAEVIAMLGGEITEREARDRAKARTRQLAKKQRTWFRHQAEVEWIDADSGDGEALAAKVVESWRRNAGVDL